MLDHDSGFNLNNLHTVTDVKCLDCTQRGTDIAEHAVKKVFAMIGVDVDNPESIEMFREDLRFNKRLRYYSHRSAIAIIGIVCAAIVANIINTLFSKF